jgi:phosphatidylethanolamine-binding protein (PEBP) family uncharacterized protein
MRILLASVILLSFASGAMADMKVSFQWGPTGKCFDRNSPPMTLSGVPEGRAKLDIRMKDLNAPDYNHGGGKVDYSGQKALAYGAFKYKGPCPPQPNTYVFTVKALDAKGKTLGTATAKRKFP